VRITNIAECYSSTTTITDVSSLSHRALQIAP
jgi:hypothetical protein